jgi:predicted Zn-dependent protease
MARFALLTDQDLDVIIDENSKNTKSVIRVSEKILNDYLKDKDGEIKSIDELDSADVSVNTLNTILRKLYGEVRKADGTCYAKKSMITVRFGLQKHFL